MRQINFDEPLTQIDFVCLHKEKNVVDYIIARKIKLQYTIAIDEEEKPEYHTIILYNNEEMLRELKISNEDLLKLKQKKLLTPLKYDEKIFWITKILNNKLIEITCINCEYKKIINENDEIPLFCEKCQTPNIEQEEQVI